MSRDSILSPIGMGCAGGTRVDISMGSVLEMGYDEDGSEGEDDGEYARRESSKCCRWAATRRKNAGLSSTKVRGGLSVRATTS